MQRIFISPVLQRGGSFDGFFFLHLSRQRRWVRRRWRERWGERDASSNPALKHGATRGNSALCFVYLAPGLASNQSFDPLNQGFKNALRNLDMVCEQIVEILLFNSQKMHIFDGGGCH